VPLPSGAQVVDAREKYLIPGLWDMHTHAGDMAPLSYPLFIVNGVTGIRDAHSKIPLDTLIRWQQEILAGTRVGPPRQLFAGPPLPELESASAEQTVADLLTAGATFVRASPFSFPVVAAARRVGVPFGGHLPDGVSALDASDSGMSMIDHANTAGGLDTLCLTDKATLAECRQLAERFKSNRTWWVPTLITGTGGGMRSRAVYERFRAHFLAFQFGPGPSASSPDTTSRPRPVTHTDSVGVLDLARRVRLPILAGTDAAPPGFSLHAELEMYVAEGLLPLQALRTATLNPAEILRDNSLGRLAPGRLADLVLLDANPLVDIRNTTTIRAVVANGRYYDRAALDRLLAEAKEKARGKP